ncbi:hypothetical protein ABPG77_000667 [Micractinium sp. CCAP 211/92]
MQLLRYSLQGCRSAAPAQSGHCCRQGGHATEPADAAAAVCLARQSWQAGHPQQIVRAGQHQAQRLGRTQRAVSGAARCALLRFHSCAGRAQPLRGCWLCSFTTPAGGSGGAQAGGSNYWAAAGKVAPYSGSASEIKSACGRRSSADGMWFCQRCLGAGVQGGFNIMPACQPASPTVRLPAYPSARPPPAYMAYMRIYLPVCPPTCLPVCLSTASCLLARLQQVPCTCRHRNLCDRASVPQEYIEALAARGACLGCGGHCGGG